MTNDGEARSSWTPNVAERGAGGKLRKQSARKLPATPYARPPQNQAHRKRWISRIVDPAYRLLAGGATRLLPYFFSNVSSANALPAPDTQAQDQDDSQDVSKKQTDDADHPWRLNAIVSRSTQVGVSSSSADRVQSNTDVSIRAKGKMVINSDDGVSELERLMEGKQFSRDEIDRLIEVIESRASDRPNTEREKRNLETPLEEAKKSIGALDSGKKPIEDRRENTYSDLWKTSTPLPVSTRPDEIGLSPADLARAYMGGQTPNLGSKSLIARDERDSLHGDVFPAKRFVPSPSGKPSAGWPGARLTEQQGYVTPLSQRERFGLHNFPRTPYSRTIQTRSKAKSMQLQDDSSRHTNLSKSPFQQFHNSSGQFKLRNAPADTVQGSAGPIRRIRHKSGMETPVRESPYSHGKNHNVSEGFFPAIKKNAGAIGSSSIFKPKNIESGTTQTVHPHTSQIARTILDHLERHQPTPKDKSAELKIATSWRKSQPSNVLEQNNGSPGSSRTDLSENNDAKKISFDQLNKEKDNSASRVLSGAPDEVEKGAKSSTSVSNGLFGGSSTAKSNDTAPSFQFGKSQESQTKRKNEDVSNLSEIPKNLPKPPSHSLGSKPMLSSISVTKPVQRWMVPSDTASGFTFPVSSSSGTSSEPPTPSIIPSTTTLTAPSNSPKPEEKDAVPSYSFGKSSSASLVFSLPSTVSNANKDEDVEDIKFSFGSEKSKRVSFASVGKNAVCY